MQCSSSFTTLRLVFLVSLLFWSVFFACLLFSEEGKTGLEEGWEEMGCEHSLQPHSCPTCRKEQVVHSLHVSSFLVSPVHVPHPFLLVYFGRLHVADEISVWQSFAGRFYVAVFLFGVIELIGVTFEISSNANRLVATFISAASRFLTSTVFCSTNTCTTDTRRRNRYIR